MLPSFQPPLLLLLRNPTKPPPTVVSVLILLFLVRSRTDGALHWSTVVVVSFFGSIAVGDEVEKRIAGKTGSLLRDSPTTIDPPLLLLPIVFSFSIHCNEMFKSRRRLRSSIRVFVFVL